MTSQSYINEEFYAASVTPEQADILLANGWRHFGTHFFRYNLGYYENEVREVFPLRSRLSDFIFSKNQRRIIKKNRDLETLIRPIVITEEKESLFDRHKKRFSHGVPNSIYDFLSQNPANEPCKGMEVCVYWQNELLAASFFDIGHDSVSGIYASFAPEENSRSLGIYTMLVEIDFALKMNKRFYYQGYCYKGNSFYDYKKRFSALEKFDWQGNWVKFAE